MEITLVRIDSTTDGKYKGLILPLPKEGEIIDYDDTRFHCHGVVYLGGGKYKAWNSNYIITASYAGTLQVG